MEMSERVAMVPLDRAAELGVEIGLPGPMATRSAFRVLANNPPLLKAVFGQLSTLLLRNTFDTRLRELMIMRIGWVTGSEYEWTQHWRVATAAGIPPEDVLAVRDWRNADRLTVADKAVLAATDETLAGKTISDATWAEVTKHVTDAGQQVEFVVAMANWTMFSILLRNLKIPVEDGVMIWPPDGKRPASAEG
jgi:alkylhydroperoxidase family enzyme